MGPEVNTIDWYFRRGGERIHKICTFFLMHAPVGEAVPEEGEGISACEWLPIEAAAERVTYLNTREVVREAARTLEAMTW